MKKLVLAISLLALGLGASAQEFVPGWTFQGKGGVGLTVGEANDYFKSLTPVGAVAVGYKFSPVLGARLDVSGINANRTAGDSEWNWKYVNPAADLTVDLCNLFGDYKFRKVNPYFLAGLGANVRFDNEAPSTATAYWEDSQFGFNYRVGGGIDFFLGKALALTLEVIGNRVPDNTNSVEGKLPDGMATAMLGIKYDLSRKKSMQATDDKAAAEAAAAAAAAAKAAADAAAAQKAAADKAAADAAAAQKAAAEQAAAEKAAAEKAAAERAEARSSANNILFVIGQSKIRDNQKEKLQWVVDKCNEFPEAQVVVSGYADKETGSAAWNMKLSQKRAEGVTKALVDAGIDPSRITTEYYGSEVNPFDTPAENRVAVAVTR